MLFGVLSPVEPGAADQILPDVLVHPVPTLVHVGVLEARTAAVPAYLERVPEVFGQEVPFELQTGTRRKKVSSRLTP